MKHPFSLLTIISFALVSLLVTQPTWAADVRAGLSSRETYVGLPVMLQIQISDAEDYEPPVIPEVDGLDIQSAGTPAQQSSITIINGRRSSSTSITFAYQVTPLRRGSFTIPAITTKVDGQQRRTRPMRLVASVSETGDLLFVEIDGAKNEIYVGEALKLTLKIWVRPFQDKERQITLSERDMWGTIAPQTSWGSFAEQIQDLAESNRRPGGNEVLREDRDGEVHSYYLYEIPATVYPQRPGELDGSDVRIVARYPTALGKSRDPFSSFFDDARLPFRMPFGDSPFGSRLAVKSVRPIVAETKMDSINVKPIPTVGRPADYRGAVGQYQIATEAESDEVAAGDPITLHIGLLGDGPMELVPAPPLAELPQLTADFKVPDEPLAGFVDDQRKIFSATIRPRNENVTEIPPIPLSYFDPELEQFVTVHSEPIPITVTPAESLSLDAIVGASRRNAGAEPTTAEDITESTMANEHDAALLVSQSTIGKPSAWLWGLMVVPPLVVLAIPLIRGWGAVWELVGWFRSPWARCRQTIAQASQPSDVASALEALVERVLRLPRGSDWQTSVGALRSAGYRDLAIRGERLFDHCHSTPHAANERLLSSIKEDASSWVEALEQRRRTAKRLGTVRRPQVTSAAVRTGLGLLLLFVWQHVALAQETTHLQLSTAQQVQLLEEAGQLYEEATQVADSDAAAAKQAFSEAADKYKMIVAAGVHNSQLFTNVANAQLHSGQVGKASANYRRALRLDPTNGRARGGLDLVLEATGTGEAATQPVDLWQVAGAANDLISRNVHPRTVLIAGVTAWLALWLVIGLRLAGWHFRWKSAAAVATTIVFMSAMSFALSYQQADTPCAVVVTPNTVLRESDGQQFAEITEIAEGQVCPIVGTRGTWIHVETPSGQQGWLPRGAVEVI